jgi:hypothetical protein
MDWGSALDAFGNYKDKEFEKAIEKLASKEGVRRSARNKGNNERVQNLAEAIKKKNNELPGTIPSPALSSNFTSVATACNIMLGSSPDKIAATISSFHANDIAKAALCAAKRRVDNHSGTTVIEGVQEGIASKHDGGEVMNIERPPKKPPKSGLSKNGGQDGAASGRNKKSYP